jgi:hypothetical protein
VPLLLILGRPEVECTSLAPEPRLRPEMIRLPPIYAAAYRSSAIPPVSRDSR